LRLVVVSCFGSSLLRDEDSSRMVKRRKSFILKVFPLKKEMVRTLKWLGNDQAC
jgi:hypothetical protein